MITIIKAGDKMLEKLLKDKEICIRNIPKTHQALLQTYDIKNTPPYDVILSFVYDLEEMKNEITYAITVLNPEGMLYLCYPKLKNDLGQFGIHRDHIFPYLKVDMTTGYMDGTLMRFNRMNALDDNYTILGIKNDTKKKSRNTTSQRVDDYANHIIDIKNILKDKSCLSFYVALTPGYQKGWARYVFSAKTEETKRKRIDDMIDLLNQGIKSKDLAPK